MVSCQNNNIIMALLYRQEFEMTNEEWYENFTDELAWCVQETLKETGIKQ